MVGHLVRVRSWQWLLAGILVGVLGALSVGLWGEPMLSAYGDSINGRREFEDALTRRQSGRPWFTDVTVHATRIVDADGGGGRRTVHVVTGMYYDGRSDGGAPPVWRPAFYVAEVPYRPATDVSGLDGGGDVARQFNALPEPTVVDFLRVMARARDVQFTHAWWRSPANARLAWLLVGVVGVGVLWPATLNLIVFGSVRRPKEAAIELPPARSGAATPDDDAAVKAAAMEQLDGAIDELLHSAASGGPTATTPPRAQHGSPPGRALTTQPLEPVQAAAATAEQKAFGAGEEDFYPTEIKAAKGHATAPKR